MDMDIPARVDTPLPFIDLDKIWQQGVDKYQSDTGITLPEQLGNAISPDSTIELIAQRHSDSTVYVELGQKMRYSLESLLIIMRMFTTLLWEGDDTVSCLSFFFLPGDGLNYYFYM